jgi:hypothetical protein
MVDPEATVVALCNQCKRLRNAPVIPDGHVSSLTAPAAMEVAVDSPAVGSVLEVRS